MGLIKSEFRRLLKNKFFYLSFTIVLLSSIMIIVRRIDDFGYNYDWLFIFLSTHGFGVYTLLPLILPLIVCIPYTSIFYEDINSKYINFIASRSNYRKYILIKIFFNMLVPIIIVALNIIISFIISKIIFKNPIDNLEGIIENHIFVELINSNNIIVFLALIILISVIFSCVFTSLGLVSTVFIKNKYISVALPFLIYIITGVIGLTLDKVYLHMGTIFMGYMYENNMFLISMLIGILVIIISNVMFYLRLYREGF